ncbi:MAG TPA: DNA recombination protein RmuC [Bacteroidales bacterium]|nr:DNA recombination protein RmuC [Bacteroidales bacterium]
MVESVIYIVTGLVIGFVLSWIAFRQIRKFEARSSDTLVDNLKSDLGRLNDILSQKEQEIVKLSSLVAEKVTNIKNLGEKLEGQKKEIEDIRKTMTSEFRLLANEILDEKSQKFGQENREKIDQILKPLNENLKEFKEKVERSRIEEREGRASLFTKIGELEKLNARISNEASALTKALKGDSKMQGNWGEMILESVLEKSGLVRDREFFIQESFLSEEGKRLIPDVIVKYPGDRSIIIDSKISLVAYEQYVNSQDDEERAMALKAHLNSIRTHIGKLVQKDYQNEYKVNTLDFIMMFMAVEPAYLLALQNDNKLWSEAYERRILLISPTNLIAALKMVESIWKQEYQSRNVMEIARQGGALYDDFVMMLERLEKLGKKLDETQRQYDETVKKLTGRGNLISRVGNLRNLGLKTKKEIPEKFREEDHNANS